MSSIDQQFIEYIIKSLVGKPDAVKVERRIDEKGVLLELTVDPEDLGRVIGKRGSTAQSIRTLLRALGTKNDARYNLKIIDTGPPRERSDDRSSYSQGPRDDSSTGTDHPASDQPAKDSPSDDSTTTATEPASAKVAKADDIDMSEDDVIPEKPKEERDHSDVISKTRKELAELDDLDV